MAPILSFTAEELWQTFTKDDSVFFTTWHELPAPADAAALLARWSKLRELRDPVRKEIEALRAEGKVGSSLQAEVEFQADGDNLVALSSLGDELRFLFMTSAVRLKKGNLGVQANPGTNAKCERCWHYTPDVNEEALCGRCVTNLRGPGETRRHV
jgi:isoleucyl-tRNA synthetase